VQGGALVRGYDPAAGRRVDRERALEFLRWAEGSGAPRPVLDALCRWIQELDRELARSAW
jgi:hypothetical protein